MASKRGLKSDDVDGFMCAFWDEIEDIRREQDVEVEMRLFTQAGRGKVKIIAMAYKAYGTPQERLVGSAEVLWPTHHATSVHALLYSLGVRLYHDVRQRAEDSTPLASSPDT